MNAETLLFILPDSLEEALYASVTIVQYLTSRYMMGREAARVMLSSQHKDFCGYYLHDYLKASWVVAEIITEPTEEQKAAADLIFHFDTQVAYNLTKAVEKSIGDSYGIQLGVGLLRFLAPIPVETYQEDYGTVLVAMRPRLDGTDETWDWPHREAFIEKGHERDIRMAFLDSGTGFQEMKSAVGRASVVVGVRSSVTLLASAANKVVLELTPKEKGHQEWVRKKESKRTRMMYGSLQDFSAEVVWKHLDKLIDDKVINKRSQPIPTEVVDV